MSAPKTRDENLRQLLADLQTRLASVRGHAAPAAALAFLDVLTRVEAFPPALLDAAGEALLEEARAHQESRRDELGAAAEEALDLEGLRAEASRLTGGGAAPVEVRAWVARCLEVANAAPALAPIASERAEEALAEAASLVGAFPAAFLDALPLAEERRALEFPGGIPLQLGEDLIAALEEAPALARADAEAEAPEGWLEGVLARLPAALQEGAEEALEERARWPEQLRAFRAAALAEARRIAASAGATLDRLLGQGGDSLALVQMAASTASDADEDHLLLRRLPEGELILSRRAASLYVDWYGEGEPALLEGAQPLPFEVREDGRRWALPLSQGEIRRTFRLGPTRIEIDLPAA